MITVSLSGRADVAVMKLRWLSWVVPAEIAPLVLTYVRSLGVSWLRRYFTSFVMTRVDVGPSRGR